MLLDLSDVTTIKHLIEKLHPEIQYIGGSRGQGILLSTLKNLLLSCQDQRIFTREDVTNKLKEQNGCCRLCGVLLLDSEAQGDHISPFSKGGRTQTDNLQVLCARCNKAKGNKE